MIESNRNCGNSNKLPVSEWFKNWKCEKKNCQEIYDCVMLKLAKHINFRKISLERHFRDFDKRNIQRVSETQMRRVLSMNMINLSDDEIHALQEKFSDEFGFHYWKFLKILKHAEYFLRYNQVPQNNSISSSLKEKIEQPIKASGIKKPENEIVQETPKTIINVIAKFLSQFLDKKINCGKFFKQVKKFDGFIKEKDFRGALKSMGFEFKEQELQLLCASFKSPYNGLIDCTQFRKIIVENMLQIKMNNSKPMMPANNHFSKSENFLNFEEKCLASQAIQKLARNFCKISTLARFLEKYDCTQSGIISTHKFFQGMCDVHLKDILSTREYAAILKCFSREANEENFKYKEFLQTVSHIYQIRT